MTRRWWIAIVLALAACTASPGNPPRHSSPPSTHPRSALSELARIYAAALTSHGLPRSTYLVARFCTGMVEIASRGPCRPGPMSAALRRDLVRLVGPRLRITSHPPRVVPARRIEPSVIRLGTADLHGATARVAIDYYCGPLCGQGMTLILKRTGDHWAVTGQTGYGWIS